MSPSRTSVKSFISVEAQGIGGVRVQDQTKAAVSGHGATQRSSIALYAGSIRPKLTAKNKYCVITGHRKRNISCHPAPGRWATHVKHWPFRTQPAHECQFNSTFCDKCHKEMTSPADSLQTKIITERIKRPNIKKIE